MDECDLIMKGGTTSGVVYPFAIQEISKKYRLRSIGGTSAGALAATLAAAAEYYRQSPNPAAKKAGFDRMQVIADELAKDMFGKLQPTPPFQGIFEAYFEYKREEAKAAAGDAEAKKTRLGRLWKAWGKLRHRRGGVLSRGTTRGGLTLGGGAVIGIAAGSLGFGLAGLLAGGAVFGGQAAKDFAKKLKEQDFGMIPGVTQDGYTEPAVVDWLADEIDVTAGLMVNKAPPETPLTMGHLEDEEIGLQLATMTTDLTSQRPFQLPFREPELYFFTREELTAVLPERIVDWMIEKAGPSQHSVEVDGKRVKAFPVPVGKDFPVVLAARMSMTVPGLFQSVVLWRRDHLPYASDGNTNPFVKCYFSDGGISSNMPVHLFDAWLPRRPTFAISLTRYQADRHGQDDTQLGNRVALKPAIKNKTDIPTIKIETISKFIFSIIHGAKDWRDTLQANLPGQAERVVEIRLKADEGGSNFHMPDDTIAELQGYGKEAGRLLANDFDFDQNRWQRAVSLMPKIEDALVALHKAYENTPAGPDKQTYKTLLEQYAPNQSALSDELRTKALIPLAEALSALGAQIEGRPSTQRLSAENLIKEGIAPIDANLRLVASPNLTTENSDT